MIVRSATLATAALALVPLSLAEDASNPVDLTNAGFETDDLGFYGVSDPDAPVTGWRVFAGQGNSGLYEFEVIEDASEGTKALRMARKASLGQGAGGGIDLTRAEIEPGKATTVTVTFDAKQTTADGPASTALVEVMFNPHKNRYKFEKPCAVTADYRSFTTGSITIPADTESINLIFRPRDAHGERGPADVVIDNVKVSLAGAGGPEPG